MEHGIIKVYETTHSDHTRSDMAGWSPKHEDINASLGELPD
jgi:hypothetical protein